MASLLLGAAFFGLALHKIEPLPLSGAPFRFEEKRAFDWMSGLAKGFPDRLPWNENHAKASHWLQDEFRKLGYEPKVMGFSEVIAGKQYTNLENIYAEKIGTTHPEEIVVVSGHYDITDTTSEGAMDDASAIGVVMELARVFSTEKTERTVIFLATDSEEFGAFWGARAFARQFDRADKIVADLNFDFVAPEKQTKIVTLCDGLKEGYTPLWLRELALDSLRSLGTTEVVDLDNAVEFAERAIGIPAADHGAFLAAGIPAFDWVGQTDNFAYEMGHYHHTQYDVVEAMRPESFAPFGQGAERLIRSIDALPRIPANFRDSSYWKVSEHLYVDGWAMTLLHALAFVPFIAYCFVKFRKSFRRGMRGKVLLVMRNEAKRATILLGSMLLGYGVMRLLPSLKIITQYETFPATQKSLILYSPDFVVMLVVVGLVIGVYWAFKSTFRDREDTLGLYDVRQAFHAALLLLVIGLAFLKNSYLATLLLVPPAYLWTAMRSRRRVEDRLMNGFLLIGGAITFVTMTIILTQIFYVGVVYWYLFLSATYGLISAYTVVLFFMVLTVMIRLFRSLVF
jgi:flagellar biogenesis protein FliO